MPRSKRLIVGLGNPGPEYAETRHNVGFVVVQSIADDLDIRMNPDAGPVEVGWGRVRSYPIGLARPQTFMNRSGEAVRYLLRRYALTLSNLLVVYDDVNLEVGRLRIRPGGSAGGHNGVQSIIDHNGSTAFPRLRIGIGRAFSRGRQSEYVLSPFAAEESPEIREAVHRASEASITFVTDGLHVAMNRYNR